MRHPALMSSCLQAGEWEKTQQRKKVRKYSPAAARPDSLLLRAGFIIGAIPSHSNLLLQASSIIPNKEGRGGKKTIREQNTCDGCILITNKKLSNTPIVQK